MALTQARLKEVLKYDPETGQFTWLVSTSNRVKVGAVAGYSRWDGYVCIRIDGILYLSHRLAWLYMTGEWPENEIDHRDLDKSNARWENLRPATRQQNAANMATWSATGFKGVHKDGKGYGARIKIDGKKKYLGYFLTPEEANAAYVKAANDAFGEFARAA